MQYAMFFLCNQAGHDYSKLFKVSHVIKKSLLGFYKKYLLNIIYTFKKSARHFFFFFWLIKIKEEEKITKLVHVNLSDGISNIVDQR